MPNTWSDTRIKSDRSASFSILFFSKNRKSEQVSRRASLYLMSKQEKEKIPTLYRNEQGEVFSGQLTGAAEKEMLLESFLCLEQKGQSV